MIYLMCIALYKINQLRGSDTMNMKLDKEHIAQWVEKGKQDVAPLLKYLDWLKENNGKDVSTVYDGRENGNNTMSFPVYDATLLDFVKEAGESGLMDRNFVYVYTEYELATPEQERQAIADAAMEDWKILCGIFTRYVRGGMTRAYLWTQGMQEGIFYLTLAKMKEVLESAE